MLNRPRKSVEAPDKDDFKSAASGAGKKCLEPLRVFLCAACPVGVSAGHGPAALFCKLAKGKVLGVRVFVQRQRDPRRL